MMKHRAGKQINGVYVRVCMRVGEECGSVDGQVRPG